jgi:hypothetical protein
MTDRILRLWPLFLVLIAVGLMSCSSSDPLVETGGKNEVTVKYVTTAPDTSDILNDDVWDGVPIVSIRVGLDPLYTDQFGAKIVRTQAVSDNENVYLKLNWGDSTQSDKPGYWSFHETGDVWTQNWTLTITSIKDTTYDTTYIPPSDTIVDTNVVSIEDTTGFEEINLLNPRWEKEDNFAIIWDNGSNGTEGANCATMCHEVDQLDTMYLTGGGDVDVWVWRAGRTDPLGLADDMFWSQDLAFDDFSQNHSSWQRNARSQSEETDPKWSHVDGAAYHGSFLFAADTVTLDFATLADWKEGDGIPGYVLDRDLKPSESAKTSRYDVKARSEYDPITNSWSVVLWRKLDTGNNDDFVFEQGKQYKMSFAVMDHTVNAHSGSAVITIKF